MKITENEKRVLKDFINCKIPPLIRDNKYNYKDDLMECYEELFNSSHSLLEGYNINSKDIFCILEDDYLNLLNKLRLDNDLQFFCDLSILVIGIVKEYLFSNKI